jgi:hypothetical protein
MPMATATAVKLHGPSDGTSITSRALPRRKASRPRNEDGVGAEAFSGGVDGHRTTQVLDVDVGRSRRLHGRDGEGGGRSRQRASSAD